MLVVLLVTSLLCLMGKRKGRGRQWDHPVGVGTSIALGVAWWPS